MDPLDQARLLLAQGAAAEATRLLRACPPDRASTLLKAEAALMLRDEAGALDLYTEALRQWPDSVQVWSAYAHALQTLERYEEGLAASERARSLLTSSPGSALAAPVYLALVLCLRGLRRYREALAAAEEGLSRIPDAVLAEWASTIEDEWHEAERDRC